jgi:hypothetical protein
MNLSCLMSQMNLKIRLNLKFLLYPLYLRYLRLHFDQSYLKYHLNRMNHLNLMNPKYLKNLKYQMYLLYLNFQRCLK